MSDSPMSDIQIGYVTSQWARNSHLPCHYAKVMESTNDLAKDEAFSTAGEDALKLYLTDAQSKGRGRGENTWVNGDAGSALLSSWSFMLQDPPLPTLTPKLGLGLARALHATWPFLPWNLKAPNDIYLGAKKVAGLLTEIVSQGDDHRLIVGLGVNVWAHPESVDTATHIAKELPAQSPLLGEDWIAFLDRWVFELSDAVGRAEEPLNTTDCEALKHFMNQSSPRALVESVREDGGLVIGGKVRPWTEI